MEAQTLKEMLDSPEVRESMAYMHKYGHPKPNPERDARLTEKYRAACAQIEEEMVADTLGPRLERREVHTILFRSGGWAATDYGIECLYDEWYAVERDRLIPAQRWLSHLAEKDWCPKESIADFALCMEYLATHEER